MKISNHWNKEQTAKDWAEIEVNQRNDKEEYITEGTHFQERAKIFSVQLFKGDYFPKQSHRRALVSDLAYVATWVPHTILTTCGNAVFGAREIFDACKEKWQKSSDAKEAFKPDYTHLRYAAKNILALGAVYAAYSYFPWATKMLAMGVFGTAALYSAYDPLGARVYIAVERVWNVKPLNDGQVDELGLMGKVEHVFKGSYSLSRILDIHRLGFSDAKEGKVLYLGYCMQKRRIINIRENRF